MSVSGGLAGSLVPFECCFMQPQLKVMFSSKVFSGDMTCFYNPVFSHGQFPGLLLKSCVAVVYGPILIPFSPPSLIKH